MGKKQRSLWITFMAFPVLSFGIALQLKAGIGQSMFNAFALILSDLSGFQIGDIINLLNGLFFLVYVMLRKEGIKLVDMLQLAAVLINGFLVNFFLYGLLAHFVLEAYGTRLAIFLLGVCLAAFSLGAILAMNLIRFPLEGLSLQIGETLNKSLAFVRLRFDIFFLVSTVILCVLFSRELYIREGTILSFILLSKLLGYAYNYYKQTLGGV